MKKYFLILLLIMMLTVTGCGKNNEAKTKNDFIKETEKLEGYYLEGVMNLTNNDDNYQYNVQVSYQKPDYYKVVLTNNANNYTQILIRNDDGVFVTTPALNKSFKFQSEWPNNNSQSYLLHSVANDLKEDKEYAATEKDGEYEYTVKANYPNNRTLTKQKITIDKDGNLKKVEVLDEKNIPMIEFTVTSIDKKAVFKDDYFKVSEEKIEKENKETKKEDDCTGENCLKNKTNDDTKEDTANTDTSADTTGEENNTSTTLSETLFPLYLPDNTTLSNKEVVKIDGGERIIMTFSGESPFILVEETAQIAKEPTIIPTYGEPFLLVDTVGSLTDMSYTWTSNGIEYYIVSDVMEQEELLEVAKSLNVVSTIATK